ncbi:hypothetical protein EQG68_02715 [Flavobacterium piscinae]|uniref:Hint domain-containing protein n=1 Tax=Flavobacterium piscinae TaxID=2506424 RepID=A0A4Q1KWZ6_9FLAO|nr:Hint domain-containing protein [Flavobacterium piscinae]RXR34838.1 hypothetical protein EQG68_02715 [Flavobacterium piscinae]
MWSFLLRFKKFTVAQNPVDFIKIFVEEVTGIAIELFLLYVSVGASATKKIAEVLERLLKNPKTTVDDWMDYFKKRKKEDVDEKPIDKALDDVEKLKIAQKMWKEFEYKDFLAKPPKKPCFLAGTFVHTTSGLELIENITKGTEVICYDEVNQLLKTQIVSEIFQNKAEKFLRISIQNGEIVEVTGQHLFYQKKSQTWIKSHQLKVGMHLYNPQNGTLEVITSLEIIDHIVDTYNFEVPIYHNYLVGSFGILAHNANKFSSINDVTTRKYAFYELFTLNGRIAETQYIGKTTREDLDLRNSEHKYHAQKKGASSKHYWKFSEKPQIANLNKGVLEFVEMTEIQSAVWEKYYLEEYRNSTGRKLRNIQNPISKSRFKALKDSGKHGNICMFFI